MPVRSTDYLPLTSHSRTDVETVIHSDNDFATVAFLRIKNAILEPKVAGDQTGIHLPPVLEPSFIALHDATSLSAADTTTPVTIEKTGAGIIDEPLKQENSTKRLGSWVSVSDIQRSSDKISAQMSIEEEVTECFLKLKGRRFSGFLEIHF